MTPQTGPEATQDDETAWDIVAALGERLERASASLLEMQMTSFERGSVETTLRLKAKREGVTLALSYWEEELRLRGVLP